MEHVYLPKEKLMKKKEDFKIPENEELLKLREDKEMFSWIVEYVIPHVVSPKEYYEKTEKKEISEFVSVSDEAFSLIAVENYRDVIQERAANPIKEKLKRGHRRTDLKQKPKYTGNGIGAKKNEGWDVQGLERFIALVDHVKEDREKDKKKGINSTEKWYLDERKRKTAAELAMKTGGTEKSLEDNPRKKLKNPIE